MVFKTLVRNLVDSEREPDDVMKQAAANALIAELKNDLIQAYALSRPLVEKHPSLFWSSRSFLSFLIRVCRIPEENEAVAADVRWNSESSDDDAKKETLEREKEKLEKEKKKEEDKWKACKEQLKQCERTKKETEENLEIAKNESLRYKKHLEEEQRSRQECEREREVDKNDLEMTKKSLKECREKLREAERERNLQLCSVEKDSSKFKQLEWKYEKENLEFEKELMLKKNEQFKRSIVSLTEENKELQTALHELSSSAYKALEEKYNALWQRVHRSLPPSSEFFAIQDNNKMLENENLDLTNRVQKKNFECDKLAKKVRDKDLALLESQEMSSQLMQRTQELSTENSNLIARLEEMSNLLKRQQSQPSLPSSHQPLAVTFEAPSVSSSSGAAYNVEFPSEVPLLKKFQDQMDRLQNTCNIVNVKPEDFADVVLDLYEKVPTCVPKLRNIVALFSSSEENIEKDLNRAKAFIDRIQKLWNISEMSYGNIENDLTSLREYVENLNVNVETTDWLLNFIEIEKYFSQVTKFSPNMGGMDYKNWKRRLTDDMKKIYDKVKQIVDTVDPVTQKKKLGDTSRWLDIFLNKYIELEGKCEVLENKYQNCDKFIKDLIRLAPDIKYNRYQDWKDFFIERYNNLIVWAKKHLLDDDEPIEKLPDAMKRILGEDFKEKELRLSAYVQNIKDQLTAVKQLAPDIHGDDWIGKFVQRYNDLTVVCAESPLNDSEMTVDKDFEKEKRRLFPYVQNMENQLDAVKKLAPDLKEDDWIEKFVRRYNDLKDWAYCLLTQNDSIDNLKTAMERIRPHDYLNNPWVSLYVWDTKGGSKQNFSKPYEKPKTRDTAEAEVSKNILEKTENNNIKTYFGIADLTLKIIRDQIDYVLTQYTNVFFNLVPRSSESTTAPTLNDHVKYFLQHISVLTLPISTYTTWLTTLQLPLDTKPDNFLAQLEATTFPISTYQTWLKRLKLPASTKPDNFITILEGSIEEDKFGKRIKLMATWTDIEIQNVFYALYREYFTLKYNIMQERVASNDEQRDTIRRKIAVIKNIENSDRPSMLNMFLLKYIEIDLQALLNKTDEFYELNNKDELLTATMRKTEAYLQKLVGT